MDDVAKNGVERGISEAEIAELPLTGRYQIEVRRKLGCLGYEAEQNSLKRSKASCLNTYIGW